MVVFCQIDRGQCAAGISFTFSTSINARNNKQQERDTWQQTDNQFVFNLKSDILLIINHPTLTRIGDWEYQRTVEKRDGCRSVLQHQNTTINANNSTTEIIIQMHTLFIQDYKEIRNGISALNNQLNCPVW